MGDIEQTQIDYSELENKLEKKQQADLSKKVEESEHSFAGSDDENFDYFKFMNEEDFTEMNDMYNAATDDLKIIVRDMYDRIQQMQKDMKLMQDTLSKIYDISKLQRSELDNTSPVKK